MKFLAVALSSLMLVACGGGGSGGGTSGTAGTSTIQNATGGTVQGQDGKVSVFIDSNSLNTSSAVIAITRSAAATALIDIKDFGLAKQESDTYEITSSDASYFSTPATVGFKFDSTQDPSSLGVAYYSGSLNKWIQISNVTVDINNKIVSAQTLHFTPFALFNITRNQPVVLQSVDSKFRAALDGLSLVNWGTGTDGGDCFGFSLLASWYYDQEKLSNNSTGAYNQFGVEAIPLISGLQSIANNFPFLQYSLTDNTAAMKIVSRMLDVTNQKSTPVMLEVSDKTAAHELVVYKYDSGTRTFFYYNPNLPQVEKTFQHNADGSLIPFEFLLGHTATKFGLTKWDEVVTPEQMVKFWSCYSKGDSCSGIDLPNALPLVTLNNLQGSVSNGLIEITGNFDGAFSSTNFLYPYSFLVNEAYQGSHARFSVSEATSQVTVTGKSFRITFPASQLIDQTNIALNLFFYSKSVFGKNENVWGAKFFSFRNPNAVASITDVSCPSAVATRTVTCTVTGSNLPVAGLVASLGTASCSANGGASATSQTFTCTPNASGSVNFNVALNGAAISGSPKAITVAAAADVTPPVTTAAPSVSGTTSTATTLSVTINKNGTGYYLVQLATAATPSVAAVQAGTSFAMTGNVEATQSIGGLAPSTAYKIYFAAKDAANNVQAAVQSVVVTTTAAADVTPPSIAISSPVASGGTYNIGTATMSVSGTASDNVGVTMIIWDNNRGGGGTANGTTSWSASGIALQSGSNVITVHAYDAAGNTKTTSIIVNYSVTDPTIPSGIVLSTTEQIFNWNLSSQTPPPPYISIGFQVTASATDPVSGGDALVMRFYGSPNGSGLITESTLPSTSFQSGGTLYQAFTANAIYGPMLDGQFSIGLRMASGTANITSFKACGGGGVASGCDTSLGVEGTTMPSGYISEGGLTWMPVTFGRLLNWTDANTYCTGTIINGQTGWRMPNQTELLNLYSSGAMNNQGWWLYGTWSSTPAGSGNHYRIDLAYGDAAAGVDVIGYAVSCVR